MAVLLDKNTRLHRPGPHRPRRHVPRQGRRRRTARTVVGGVTPGKGGTTHEGWPVFNTVHDAVRGDRRERVGDLRAAAVRGRRDHGSGRRRHRRWSSASPKAFPTLDMMRAMTFLEGQPATRLDRPELPGRHLAGQGARPASSPATSARKAASASCRRAARSPTRRSIS